jgi:biotin transport system substrate-specific component
MVLVLSITILSESSAKIAARPPLVKKILSAEDGVKRLKVENRAGSNYVPASANRGGPARPNAKSKGYNKTMKTRQTSLRGLVYASLFGALTAVGAYIIIPLPPGPITLQTLFMGLAGTLLGARLGAASQVVYLFLGIIGLPVFAGGKAGLGVLFGPTGGYLIGFVVAAFVIGKLTALKARPGFAWLCLSLVAGTLLLYALGVFQLSLVARLSPQKALAVGLLPFLAGDAVKILLTAWIALKLRDRFGGKLR